MTENEIEMEGPGVPTYTLEALGRRFWFADLDGAIVKFKELLESKTDKTAPDDLKIVRFTKTNNEKNPWKIVQLSSNEVYGRAYAPKKYNDAHEGTQEGDEENVNGS